MFLGVQSPLPLRLRNDHGIFLLLIGPFRTPLILSHHHSYGPQCTALFCKQPCHKAGLMNDYSEKVTSSHSIQDVLSGF